ncbi:hypothetical protein ACFPM0_29265 [Pseudonocardia sulfidoxydans]
MIPTPPDSGRPSALNSARGPRRSMRGATRERRTPHRHVVSATGRRR